MQWAAARPDIVGMALVGSYARNQPRMGSDVDVVMLVTDPAMYPHHPAWFRAVAPRAELIRSAVWGVLLERRFRLPSGLHVEIGIVRPDWAGLPLDPGTRRVLADGHRILLDPHRILAKAIATLSAE